MKKDTFYFPHDLKATRLNNLLEAALEYRFKYNWSVIPLSPGAKIPPKGFDVVQYRSRLAGKEEIESWWSNNPNYNIGIITGKLSNILAIDLDKYKPEYSEETVLQYIPDSIETVIDRSPRGGEHLYFQYPDDIDLTIHADTLPGVDYRGEGGYILAPPSVFEGKISQWIIPPNGKPLAPAPVSLLRFLKRGSNNNNISTFNIGECKNLTNLTNTNIINPYKTYNILQSGHRDQDLFTVANALVKNKVETEFIKQVVEILADNCNPPFPKNEAEIKILSAIERAKRKERNLTAEIREFVTLQEGYFDLTFVYTTLQILTKEEKNNAMVIINRLCKEGVIEKYGNKRGCYIPIREIQENIIDLSTADTTCLDIKLPLGIHDLVKIMPKNIIMVAGESNAGKGHPYGTKILVLDGWKNVEDLKIQDVVFSEKGEQINIENVFHRGEQDCYRFKFNDGTEIETDSEHIWSILWRYNRIHQYGGHNAENKDYGKYKLATTREIVEFCGIGKVKDGRKFVLPQLEPIKYDKKDLILDPYLLGVLLGDGGFTESSIKVSSADQEILDGFTSNGFQINHDSKYDYRIIGMVPIIKNLNLHGLKSDKKFIPHDYLYNSIENRIAILSGLMDTDGHVNKKRASLEFCSVSKQLAEDVIFLVRSLGGRAVCSEKQPTYSHKGIKQNGQKAYRVTIKMNNVCPFRLPRKINQYRVGVKRDGKIIRSIEYSGKKKTICIKVSNPTGLYVAQNFIITHNTALLLNIAAKNMLDYPVFYFSSEMGGAELKERLLNFRDHVPLELWKKCTFIERANDFDLTIRPDAINIIDFLEIHDEFYKIGGYIKKIFDKLNKGIAIIAIQKNKGRDDGLGGARSIEKARLYLSMAPGIIKIVKAKNWVSSLVNPNGLQINYKLAKGIIFKADSNWEKCDV